MGLLEETLEQIVPKDPKWETRAVDRLDRLTMPHWALGRVMDLAQSLAGMTRSLNPRVDRKVVIVFAGDHGVTAEGVSLYPGEVTAQMVRNFAAGGAGINALAKVCGARLVVVNMGVNGDLTDLAQEGHILDRSVRFGTGNIAQGPAMSRDEAVRCVEAGVEIALDLGDQVDVLGTGDMGIGNTTPSTAIAALLTGVSVEKLAGRGTGIGEEQLAHKVDVIQQALEVNRPDSRDGLDVLARVGGFEIGGIAGVILGAARLKKPVVIDGFISTAGALIASRLAPHSVDYMVAGHQSVEPGHRLMLAELGKRPLLDLELRLGEGTGAALAMPILDAAVGVLTQVSTFEEAAVSEAV